MSKGNLFCIKTKIGYGLFQEFDSYPNQFHPFFLVYCNQLTEIDSKQIEKTLQGEFYYERINFGMGARFDKFDINRIIENQGVEFGPEDFGINIDDFYFGNSYIIYLGNYELPKNARIPRYTRQLEFSYYTGKHCWFIHDDKLHEYVKKENGKFKIYKTLTPEIAAYPLYFGTYPRDLVEQYNANYTQTSHDDKEVEQFLEEYYREHPDMRPSNEKFDDVKFPLPTDNLRNMLDKSDDNTNYLLFCDRLEKTLMEFISTIESNKRAVKEPLKALLKELNNIEKETELIGSLEAEELYEYIVRILKSLKKPNLIEFIEEVREW